MAYSKIASFLPKIFDLFSDIDQIYRVYSNYGQERVYQIRKFYLTRDMNACART